MADETKPLDVCKPDVRDGIEYNYDYATCHAAEALGRAIYFDMNSYKWKTLFDQQAINEVVARRKDLRGGFVVVIDYLKDKSWKIFVRHEGDPRKA